MTEELKDVTDSLELVPVTNLEVGFVLKAAEMKQAQAEVERNAQNQFYTQNQPEFNSETVSEDNQPLSKKMVKNRKIWLLMMWLKNMATNLLWT